MNDLILEARIASMTARHRPETYLEKRVSGKFPCFARRINPSPFSGEDDDVKNAY